MQTPKCISQLLYGAVSRIDIQVPNVYLNECMAQSAGLIYKFQNVYLNECMAQSAGLIYKLQNVYLNEYRPGTIMVQAHNLNWIFIFQTAECQHSVK